MQHQVEQRHPKILTYEYSDSVVSASDINPKNDCGGVAPFYSHYRVGYDGQNKVFSIEYALILFSALLFISFDGNQNTFASSKAQLYVQCAFYVSTYEGVRHILGQDRVLGSIDSRVKALIAGGAASLVGQTIVVPFDILSQHLMVLGIGSRKYGKNYINKMEINPLGLTLEPGKTHAQISADIIKLIYQRDGYRGFYRGYVASLCAYVPNSALWWGLYISYQEELIQLFPEWFSHLFIQAVAGTLGGFTTTIVTNPLDIVRARLQVQRLDSMFSTFKVLWVEERLQMFTKGLSARLVQSACFSFSIILGYETIKRFSINEEYKSYIRW
ncbi:solute carrier family 25 member 44 isoform X2 [Colletes latitarsis]|uniref:solute carrier family 25 member 44 isoform X2 n=1 Tax=Colletes latitarsis TaxID=2605962 RepID=UPI00403557C4